MGYQIVLLAFDTLGSRSPEPNAFADFFEKMGNFPASLPAYLLADFVAGHAGFEFTAAHRALARALSFVFGALWWSTIWVVISLLVQRLRRGKS
jgi:hypothetical protein